MKIKKLWFDDTHICMETDMGEVGKLPLDDFPTLKFATPEQRNNYEFSPFGIHWPDLDEDLSYAGFFDYQPSPQTEIRRKLGKVLDIVSMSYVASRYFGKSRSWINQRINGSIVNGKPARFTSDEIKILIHALQEISRDVGAVSVE